MAHSQPPNVWFGGFRDIKLTSLALAGRGQTRVGRRGARRALREIRRDKYAVKYAAAEKKNRGFFARVRFADQRTVSTPSLPPSLITSAAARIPRRISSNSWLRCIRNAWNVSFAGCMA